MKLIKLHDGRTVIVDASDYQNLIQFKWYAKPHGNTVYAYRKAGGRKRVLMHRQILNISDKRTHVDHKNGNGLDNRRCNIRACTHSQNQMNRRVQANNSSGYKGVTLTKTNKWSSVIQFRKKPVRLGLFDNKEDAARAYNRAAKRLFGEFANPNEI